MENDLDEQRRELEHKLKMHAASMGGNVRYSKNKKVSNLLKTEKKVVDTVTDLIKVEKETEVKVEPTETVYELTQKALEMADKIMATKGVKEMASNPIMSATNTFKQNPARQKSQNQQDNSEPKSEENKQTISDKDPNFTILSSGPDRPLKMGDTEADILAKMYNFMVRQYEWDKKNSKDLEKYRKDVVDQKDRFTEELVFALTGKKSPDAKKGAKKPTRKFPSLIKAGVMAAGGLGAFFLAEKALAKVDWKSFVPSFLGKNNIDVGDVSSLGDLVGKLESGGDYNKLVTPTGKGITPEKPITEMTLDEVSKLQTRMKKSGDYPSTAVGKYQYLQDTLKDVAQQEGLDTATTKFTPEVQEQLFKRTLKNRGLEDYQSGKISKEEFQNQLAMEFASIPVATDVHRPAGKGYKERDIKAGESYYSGVGTNKELVSSATVSKLLEELKSPTLTTGSAGKIDPSKVRGKFGEQRPDHTHMGIDIKGAQGDAVVSTAQGVVTNVGNEPKGYGTFIEVDHGNNVKTRYAHLSKTDVKAGDMVSKGQKIGEVGSTGHSTGPHLHYEVLENGEKVDPQRFMNISPVVTASLESPDSKISSADDKLKETKQIKTSMGTTQSSLAVVSRTNNNFSGDTHMMISSQSQSNWPAFLTKQYPVYRA
jgi:murein DD-endopeptidase MepM/ murein hydrolase activator NlpD